MGFMAFYAVIEPSKQRRRIRVLGRSGREIIIAGPATSEEHEQWHTDGAKVNYQSLSPDVIQRPGYNTGAMRAMAKANKCLREAAQNSVLNSDSKCLEAAKTCIQEHFASFNARFTIMEHGHWHGALLDDDTYRWNMGKIGF